MPSEKQRLLAWLYRIDFPEGELLFADVLRRGAIEALGKDPIDADGYAQANETRIWNAVQRAAAADRERGLFPRIQVSDAGLRRATWTLRLRGDGLSSRERRRRVRARARAPILRGIDNLSPREYEALGAVASRFAGADRTCLTPQSGEGGIDFFARLRQPGSTHVFSGLTAPFRVVGQAKKYWDKVGVEKVREFVTSIEGIRHQAAHLEPLVPAWFSDSSGPVVGWLISHSGFQSGAETLARNHGILISASLDLAEVCSQARAHSEEATPAERASRLGDEIARALAG